MARSNFDSRKLLTLAQTEQVRSEYKNIDSWGCADIFVTQDNTYGVMVEEYPSFGPPLFIGLDAANPLFD